MEEVFRSYYRDSTLLDLDELYWRFFGKPYWAEVFRATELEDRTG